MKSKHIIISGLLASLLLIFLCIFMNAERYYNEIHLDNKKDLEEKILLTENKAIFKNEKLPDNTMLSTGVSIPDFSSDRFQNIETDENSVVLKAKDTIETSTFFYKRTKKEESIGGILPLLENDDELKDFIAHCARNHFCKNSVTFIDNEETLSWKKLMVLMFKFIYQEKIKNIQITLKNYKIIIEGEFKNIGLKERFLSLMSDYDTSYEIIDKSTVYVEKKEDPIVKIPQNISLNKNIKDINQSRIIEQKIAKILKTKPITFQKNKGAIRLSGRKTLDRVIHLLRKAGHFFIIVEGHTDAGGRASINMRISKARAKSVKHYLVKKGLNEKQIVAKGYGETKPLASTNPYSKRNRRVEIHLKELR